MADSFTANYNLTKVEVGASANTWGGKLNSNFDTLDTQLKAVSTTATAAMPKAGGTFSGSITMAATTTITLAADPTSALHAATKQYVDNTVSPVSTVANNALPKAGGTMTGALTLSGAPTVNLHAATKQYVDSSIAGAGGGDITGVTAGNGLTGGATSGNATLAVGAGDGITVNSSDVAVTIPNRAWGNVASNGTLNAGSSGVSSSRSVTGRYTISIPTQPDTNYAILAMCVGVQGIAAEDPSVVTKTTSQFGIRTRASGAGDTDFGFYFLIVR